MGSLKVLDLGKVKYVHVLIKGWQAPLIYTCYDQNEGVFKEENGMGWVHVVQLMRHPASDFEPRWMPTVSLEHIERVEVNPFMENLARCRARTLGCCR